MLHLKAGLPGIINFCSHDICRKHIRGKLETPEICLHSPGKGFDCQGFCQPGKPFKEDMATGEQADQKSFDQLLLADNYLGHLISQG